MSKKILVVDDDPNITELLRANLVQAGYDVATANDGTAGLEKFKAQKPDLIIVDILMPGVDGYHFVWDIFYEDGLYVSPVPKVIMLTGRDKKLDRGISEKIGVDAYITKPFEVEYIIKEVKKLLESGAEQKNT